MTTKLSTPAEQIPLPAGWRWARLGDVCNQDRSIIEPDSPVAANLPYLSLEHIESETGRVLGTGNPSEVRSTTFAFDSRHVLYGKLRPYLNKVALPDFKGRCTTELIPLLPRDLCDREYLTLLLRRSETVTIAMQQKTGSRMPRADMDDLLRMIVPVPPLPEQRRIAARLNELMAEIARARAAAQAALNAASALPAALLRAVFESDEAKKWKTVKIGDVCNRRQDIVHPKDGTKGELRFVGLENIESNTGRRLGEQILDAEALDGRKPRFFAGDVLYGYLRPYLNKVWVAEFDGVSSVDQYAFRVDKDRAIPQYIAQYMRSPVYLNLAPVGFTPGFLPRIRSEEVESVPIPLPPLIEQQRISTEIDNSLEVAQQVRASAQSQLDAINALPAAYLRKAFKGEL